MFVRVKTTPNSPRKSVQIVQSTRINGKVRQRIVKHIGVALDDEQLEELQSLVHCIKLKLELSEQLPIYTPEMPLLHLVFQVHGHKFEKDTQQHFDESFVHLPHKEASDFLGYLGSIFLSSIDS